MVQNIKVIAVDDDHVNLQLIAAFLYEDQYQLTTAGSGEEALEILEKDNSFDVILLDWMMPGMDGFEVCQKLKANQETKDIPVVFLSGKDNEEDKAKGMALGAVDFIAKPINMEMVISKLKENL